MNILRKIIKKYRADTLILMYNDLLDEIRLYEKREKNR
jgi:hypothetical protein